MEILGIIAEIFIAIILLALICFYTKKSNVLAVIILIFLLLLDSYVIMEIMPQLLR